MNRKTKILLELAINLYSLSSATEVFNLIEKQRNQYLLNGTIRDFFTKLPRKPIGDDNYIQIIGTDKNGLVYIATCNITVSVNYLEIKNCIRRMKLEEIFVK